MALKIANSGMLIEEIGDVLEVQQVTNYNWLFRAVKQCDVVNEENMKNLKVPKIKIDELYTIVKKNYVRTENEDNGI